MLVITYGHNGGHRHLQKIKRTTNYGYKLEVKWHYYLFEYNTIYSSYMVLSGSGFCRFSTKQMQNNTAKHTKSSAWVWIEPESAEGAPGQILAQDGSMGHIDLGRLHRWETEKRVVCVSSDFTYMI